ncbi:MAG: DUF4097 family beta strand repeat protein [Anaerolineae bacterium]|nr:DUF4097 family beta strand repeat protein [Anaerolineae bacterium]
MTATHRGLLWPVLIIAGGSLWLCAVVGVFPDAVKDILERVWPALLVFFGFDVLFGRRQIRVGRVHIGADIIGLVATITLVSVLVWLAYGKQADVVRDDTVQTFAETLSADISQIRVDLSVKRTAVTIRPSTADPRDLSTVYKGPSESDVEIAWVVNGSEAVLTVTEKTSTAVPKLESFGRGTLEVILPPKVRIEQLTISGEHGDADVDIRPLQIDQVTVSVDSGNLALVLPDNEVLTGVLEMGDGGIKLSVPRDVALTLSLAQNSGEPSYEYDTFRYDVLRNGTLKVKNTDTFQVGLTVSLDDGASLIVQDLE